VDRFRQGPFDPIGRNVRLVLVVLLLAIGIGVVFRGRLSGLSGLRVRFAPLAVAGLLLQLLAPSRGQWPYLLLMASFVLLTVFAVANFNIVGFPLILAGMLLNFLVIGINHGMPVTAHALSASGQQSTLTDLIRNGGEKHHLAGPKDRLLLLGDVIAVPPPVTQAVSAGDVVAYTGVGVVVVAAMRRRRPVLQKIAIKFEGAAGG
jgi:Family of unknown function (DUF5317)